MGHRAHTRTPGEYWGGIRGTRGLFPSRPLTLVELGVAQEEGAVEDGQDPAEGQQVKDTDRAQQRSVKPGKEQQDTAVKTELFVPKRKLPSFTCSLQVPNTSNAAPQTGPLSPLSPTQDA